MGGLSEAGQDRRVRRTRRLLREALLSLIEEKGYDRVTVQDVIDRADLSRATFYSHFRDKDDLLVSGFEELRETLRGAMAAYVGSGKEHSDETLGAARPLFEHVAGHRQLYRGFVGSRARTVVLKYVREQLSALVREHFQEVIASRRTVPGVAVEVTAEFVAGALLGVLEWWLENDTPYPSEQMALMFERLAASAVAAGLGLAQ